MNDESHIVKEVRDRASAISERYGNDLRRYARHLAEIELANALRHCRSLDAISLF